MRARYLTPKNHLEKITEVFVYASSDKDGEGVIAQTIDTPDGMMMMPFICADRDRMESLRPMAERIARESGKKIKLIRLSVREELEDII